MPRKPKGNYSLEVKLSADTDQPIAPTARELGANINTLHNWLYQKSKSGTDSSLKTECHHEEVRRLKKELQLVKQERDLLKKAAAYFAKESQT